MSGLKIGSYQADTPVVLAPMAGVTNSAFRKLCRSYGGGFYVSEMVTSRALVERSAESMRLITFESDERPRSLQLYGVEPTTIAAAIRMVVEEDRADHIDLNFGCPVAKVTSKGGGAALPWKTELFADIVRAAVAEADRGNLPLTVKMRKGIDDDHMTYLEAGRIAEAEGVVAIALHGRTAAQHYSGRADWSAIARLKEAVTGIPVLGNGDIWTADDAVAMLNQTGCDGVVIGRGCLGRPWLFADLDAALVGLPERSRPTLGEVASVMLRHATLLIEHYRDEHRACMQMRKHNSWYVKGYSVGSDLRRKLAMIDDMDDLESLIARLDFDQVYPGSDAEGVRGKQGAQHRVSLPPAWLKSRSLDEHHRANLRKAELSVSGG